MPTSLNLLFVCSRNQWRSPTAETIYRNHPGINVRSAGTSTSARRRINASDLDWADLILVMENRQRQRLRQSFPTLVATRELHVLDIEDCYHYMDPELIDELRAAIDPILDHSTPA